MKAKIFWSGNSQAVRIPKAFRFDDRVSEVYMRREGQQIILEPVRPQSEPVRPQTWPESFWQAFGDMPADFDRAPRRSSPRASLDP